jgi:four helix bundle protein
MKNFKQLRVLQKGFEIAINAFKLVETFPKEHRFGLSSQIIRAAASIPSNIAEGSSRNNEKDYFRFLEISLGSAYELETHLMISETLKYGDQELLSEVTKNVLEEQKMLISFMAKLKK